MVQTDSLGQWITMPIRYDNADLKYYVMFGEERIEDPNYQTLMGILSARTLNGDFSALEADQRERIKRRKERRGE